MGLHDNQNCINPCPYPDCKGTYAHPSPHLIEATAIDQRIDEAIKLERKRFYTFIENLPESYTKTIGAKFLRNRIVNELEREES